MDMFLNIGFPTRIFALDFLILQCFKILISLIITAPICLGQISVVDSNTLCVFRLKVITAHLQIILSLQPVTV